MENDASYREIINMIHISASTIKDFISCPKKIEFRMHKQGDADSVPTPEMVSGTIVHAVIEKAWKDKAKAMKELDKQIQDHPGSGDRKKMVKCIDNFFEQYSHLLGPDDLVEKYFKVPFSSGAMLTGKIDRVHNHVIYDWKTGDVPPEDLDRDPQFIMYYIAYKKMYKREPSALYYASLAHKKGYLFTPRREIIAEFQEEIIPYIVKQITSNNLPRLGFYGFRTCTKCPFKEMCWRGIDE